MKRKPTTPAKDVYHDGDEAVKPDTKMSRSSVGLQTVVPILCFFVVAVTFTTYTRGLTNAPVRGYNLELKARDYNPELTSQPLAVEPRVAPQAGFLQPQRQPLATAEAPPVAADQPQVAPEQPQEAERQKEVPKAASVATTVSLTEEGAAELNKEFQDLDLDELLRRLVRMFGHHLVQFSSFGPSGMVVIDKLASLGLLAEVPLVTIDTLHLFPETHQHIENVTKRYKDLALKTYYPEGYGQGQGFKFDYSHGDDMWTYQWEQYTYITKVEPTMRALRELHPKVWITGRRRSQGDKRRELPIVEFDEGRFKVNPMAAWTSEEVWEYIRSHHVPYNALHDRGYASIGDTMNTRPIKVGEEERAGRFQHSGSGVTECGMHEHHAKIENMKREAEKNKKKVKVPELLCEDCVQLHPSNFEEVVLKTKTAVLVEFYSPLCGHCQHFGPTYDEVATSLKAKHIIAARMDMLNYTVPKVGKNAGIVVRGYPSVYLSRYDGDAGKVQLVQYTEDRTVPAILKWIKEQVGDLVPEL